MPHRISQAFRAICLGWLVLPLAAGAGMATSAGQADGQQLAQATSTDQPRDPAVDTLVNRIGGRVDAARESWATQQYPRTGRALDLALSDYRTLLGMADTHTDADLATARHARWATEDLLFQQQRYTWSEIDRWMTALEQQSRDLARRIH